MSVIDRYPDVGVDRLGEFSIKAVFAGVTTVLLVLVIGQYVGQNTETATGIDPYKQAMGILFIGMATGYFLGRAAKGDDSPTTSYLVGFFGTTAAVSLYLAWTSLLTPILGLSMITIFLMYDSDLIEKGSEIDDFFFLLIEILSGLLGALAVVHYLSPTLVEILGPILELVPEWVIVAVTVTVLLAVGLLVVWKVAPIVRNMLVRLNGHLNRIRNRYSE